MEGDLGRDAEALPVHLAEPAPGRFLRVEPVREGMRGAAGRIGRAPGGIQREQHRAHARPAQEQARQAALLVGRRGVDREVGEMRPEGSVEVVRIEQARRRGAEHRRVETARSGDPRVHEALVAIHDRPRRARHGAQAIRIHRRDEADHRQPQGQARETERPDKASPIRRDRHRRGRAGGGRRRERHRGERGVDHELHSGPRRAPDHRCQQTMAPTRHGCDAARPTPMLTGPAASPIPTHASPGPARAADRTADASA